MALSDAMSSSSSTAVPETPVLIVGLDRFAPAIFTAPAPFALTSKSISVSSPVAVIDGALVVAALVIVTSLTADAVAPILSSSSPSEFSKSIPVSASDDVLIVGGLPVAALVTLMVLTAFAVVPNSRSSFELVSRILVRIFGLVSVGDTVCPSLVQHRLRAVSRSAVKVLNSAESIVVSVTAGVTVVLGRL